MNPMFQNAIRFILMSAGCAFMLAAQNQPQYVVDQCVKVNSGKASDITAYLSDVSAKLEQVVVDESRMAWFIALAAVSPVGEEARCDYHMVGGFNGIPPAPGSRTAAELAADLKKAGITATSAELTARRVADGRLINTDTWQVRAEVGPKTEKGAFVRINYYKVKPGQGAAYLKLETTGWKPFVESLKDSHISWHLNTLSMPTESYGHYNAMTVDVYPTWEALWKGWPAATEWPKVHPDLPYADYIKQVGDAAERYGADVLRVVLVVAPKK